MTTQIASLPVLSRVGETKPSGIYTSITSTHPARVAGSTIGTITVADGSRLPRGAPDSEECFLSVLDPNTGYRVVDVLKEYTLSGNTISNAVSLYGNAFYPGYPIIVGVTKEWIDLLLAAAANIESRLTCDYSIHADDFEALVIDLIAAGAAGQNKSICIYGEASDPFLTNYTLPNYTRLHYENPTIILGDATHNAFLDFSTGCRDYGSAIITGEGSATGILYRLAPGNSNMRSEASKTFIPTGRALTGSSPAVLLTGTDCFMRAKFDTLTYNKAALACQAVAITGVDCELDFIGRNITSNGTGEVWLVYCNSTCRTATIKIKETTITSAQPRYGLYFDNAAVGCMAYGTMNGAGTIQSGTASPTLAVEII